MNRVGVSHTIMKYCQLSNYYKFMNALYSLCRLVPQLHSSTCMHTMRQMNRYEISHNGAYLSRQSNDLLPLSHVYYLKLCIGTLCDSIFGEACPQGNANLILHSCSSRVMEIQVQMSERAIELLALPEDEPCFILDIG